MRLCWLYQKAASWALDPGGPIPAWWQRHSTGCPDCRRFQTAQSQLTAALTSGAEAHLIEAPVFLHARITSALRSGARRAPESFSWIRWLPAALVPALGVAICGVYLTMRTPRPYSSVSVPGHASASISLADAVEKLLPQTDPDRLLAWTERADLPLQSELDSVMSDARSAFQALTKNFLPEAQPVGPRQE